MAVVRVGVIGCGYWGPNLVRNFSRNPESQVHAVCDSRAARADRVAAEYRIPVVTTNASEVVRSSDLDLIVIATPSHTHFDLARAAIHAGKHVLVTKPFTTRSDHAEELCALANRQGVLLAVDHTFVFTDAVRRMRQLVAGGEIGDLYYFDSVRINLGLIQADVNVLWDLAPHDVSIMECVISGDPVSVSAIGACHGGSPTENIAYLTVRYGDSLIAHVHVNWLAPAKVRRTIVGGSKKMMVYDDMEPSEKLKIYDRGFSVTDAPSADDDYRLMVSYRTGDMWAPQLGNGEALTAEVANIVGAIRCREPLTVDGWAGMRVVRILEAGERSIKNGGSPMTLGTGPGEARGSDRP